MTAPTECLDCAGRGFDQRGLFQAECFRHSSPIPTGF
jgi:hypothetical protein